MLIHGRSLVAFALTAFACALPAAWNAISKSGSSPKSVGRCKVLK